MAIALMGSVLGAHMLTRGMADKAGGVLSDDIPGGNTAPSGVQLGLDLYKGSNELRPRCFSRLRFLPFSIALPGADAGALALEIRLHERISSSGHFTM